MYRETLPHTVNPVPRIDLQSALDLPSLWKSCLEVLDASLPYSACELFFDFDGFEPRRALQHVRTSRRPGYTPPVSLSIAGPFLQKHPRERLYSYSQIVLKDPEAKHRRLEQERAPEWDEFVQSAFWNEGRLEAVLGISWAGDQAHLSRRGMDVLRSLYLDVEEGIRRLRTLENERLKYSSLERFLEQMPAAVMLVGIDGNTMFGNAHARTLCERWNAGLDGRAMRVPNHLDGMIEDAPAPCQPDAQGPVCTIRHPCIPSLSLRAGIHWQTPGLRALPCYVIELFDDEERQIFTTTTQSDLLTTQAETLRQLAPRERRVALLVAEGMRNEQIAQKLVRSRRTIEFQIASVYRKLGISSRVQLTRLLSGYTTDPIHEQITTPIRSAYIGAHGRDDFVFHHTRKS
jgi:DNA-binding CsgD family transcriptional regulator